MRGVALGLRVPRVEARRAAPRPWSWTREVDDRRRPAERRRARAGLEVSGERAAERQLHVGVDVDRRRDDVLAGRVDRLVGCRRPMPVGRSRDRLAVDEDVGRDGRRRR